MSPEEVTHEVRRLEITTRHLVRDIMAGEYSSAFRGRGVEFAQRLVLQAWGGLDFQIRDPGGNRISFVEYRAVG